MYKTYSGVCEGCGEEFSRAKKCGPKSKYCSDKCRPGYRAQIAKAKRPRITRDCPVCGTQYTGTKGKKTCSAKCRTVYKKTTETPNSKCEQCSKMYWTNKNASRFCSTECGSSSLRIVPDSTCKRCSKVFRPRQKEHATFCSRPCFFRLVRSETKARARIEQLADMDEMTRHLGRRCKVNYSPCIECGTLIVGRKSSSLCSNRCKQISANKTAFGAPRVCGVCEKTFTWNEECYADMCSSECRESRKREVKKRNHKIAKYRRRAMLKRVRFDRFDPHDVFKRDSYKCQHCKRKTKPNADVNHPLYPNLDHIIPVSKGGGHTKKNTQCLCRKCNIDKSDKEYPDQLLLVG